MKQERLKLFPIATYSALGVAQCKEWEPQLHVTRVGKKADPEGWTATAETSQKFGNKVVACHGHLHATE